jgi:alpha-1,3/alpha-1,6-mannosyltransferase
MMRMIYIGGYDSLVKENVEYMKELEQQARTLDLKVKIQWSSSIYDLITNQSDLECDVLFAPSIHDDDRHLLLQSAMCVIYTPEREHFGIVPIEAMALGTLVIAVHNGGPVESIIDGQTGFLVSPAAHVFAQKIEQIFKMPSADYQRLSDHAISHVRDRFSFSSFALSLEHYCYETVYPSTRKP